MATTDMTTNPTPQGDLPELPEPLSNFTEGQWWIKELDALVADSDKRTDDQYRAVAVVHHLLRAIAASQAVQAPAAWQAREMLDEGWSEWREYRGTDLDAWRARVERRPDIYQLRALIESTPPGEVRQALTDEQIEAIVSDFEMDCSDSIIKQIIKYYTSQLSAKDTIILNL